MSTPWLPSTILLTLNEILQAGQHLENNSNLIFGHVADGDPFEKLRIIFVDHSHPQLGLSM